MNSRSVTLIHLSSLVEKHQMTKMSFCSGVISIYSRWTQITISILINATYPQKYSDNAKKYTNTEARANRIIVTNPNSALHKYFTKKYIRLYSNNCAYHFYEHSFIRNSLSIGINCFLVAQGFVTTAIWTSWWIGVLQHSPLLIDLRWRAPEWSIKYCHS